MPEIAPTSPARSRTGNLINSPSGWIVKCLALVSTSALLCTCPPRAFAEAKPLPFKLLFSGQQDLIDPWGKLHISASPAETISHKVPQSEMSRRAARDKPGRSLVGCFPQADGSWEVFSQEFQLTEPGSNWYEQTSRWKLLRGITRDGVTFRDVKTVIQDTTGTWTSHIAMAHNPDAGEYLMLKITNSSYGFAYHAFLSPDGRKWRKHAGSREGGAVFLEPFQSRLRQMPVQIPGEPRCIIAVACEKLG